MSLVGSQEFSNRGGFVNANAMVSGSQNIPTGTMQSGADRSTLSVGRSVVNQQVHAVPRKPPTPVVIVREAEPIVVVKTENAVGT